MTAYKCPTAQPHQAITKLSLQLASADAQLFGQSRTHPPRLIRREMRKIAAMEVYKLHFFSWLYHGSSVRVAARENIRIWTHSAWQRTGQWAGRLDNHAFRTQQFLTTAGRSELRSTGKTSRGKEKTEGAEFHTSNCFPHIRVFCNGLRSVC